MKAVFLLAAMIALPVAAEDAPKSEAGTQFIERCLKDVSDNRIDGLKRRAPEYAASLSDEELLAGGMRTAKKACPCFLQIIAVDGSAADESPEEKVAEFVAYLSSLGTDDAAPMPPSLSKLTRLCGVRSSVLPQSWIRQ